jgi:hypothetical protein
VTETTIAGLEALGRLVAIAQRDTGQSRRVANFLLAWYNAEENGGWDPTDLWGLDAAIAADLLAVLHLLCEEHAYPENLGFGDELKTLWQLWRAPRE